MSGVSIATGVIATDALGGGQGRGLQSPGVLAQSAVPASVTGTTSETMLATIPIPAGAMGVNGLLRITTVWSFTNSANNKTLKCVLGGQTFNQVTTASTASARLQAAIQNRGAANSQVSAALGNQGIGTNGSAVFTGTVDTAAAQNLTITGTLANTGETITLEAYTVELLNP